MYALSDLAGQTGIHIATGIPNENTIHPLKSH